MPTKVMIGHGRGAGHDSGTAISEPGRRELIDDFQATRRLSERLCEPLEAEDCVIQASPDVSPTKWHLAHTTWFFETFLLASFVRDYQPVRAEYSYLFNSYYQAVGPRHARPQRGFLSRPTVAEVFAYRAAINERMLELLSGADDAVWSQIAPLVVLGINHEQQHQELMLTDLKFNFSVNPTRPAYRELTKGKDGGANNGTRPTTLGWIPFSGGVHEIGHNGSGFCYDNELPLHRVYLQDYQLADRLITNGEYLEFMEAGGYAEPRFWLADGWDWVQREGIRAPLHWERDDGDWLTFTLGGAMDVNTAEPVSHVSFYEAEAFATWKGCRLATEAEWEVAARSGEDSITEGNFLENDVLHPQPPHHASGEAGPFQMLGDVWEWTGSAYLPYPGYKPAEGALGEYNGKFMSGQMVLKGGSCVTPRSHIRAAYRNFFQPDKRWQFTGIRLAADL